MIERKCIHASIANDGVYVVFKATDAVADRSFYACVIAARPSFAEFADGRHLGIRPATEANGVDVAARASASDLVWQIGRAMAGRSDESVRVIRADQRPEDWKTVPERGRGIIYHCAF